MPTIEEEIANLNETYTEVLSILSMFHEDFVKSSKKSEDKKLTLGAASFKPVVDSITKTSKATDKLLKQSFENLTHSSFNNTENIISAIEGLSTDGSGKKEQTLAQKKFIDEVSAIPDALDDVAEDFDEAMDDLLGSIAGSKFVAEGVEIPEIAIDEPIRKPETTVGEVAARPFAGLGMGMSGNVPGSSDIIGAISEGFGKEKTPQAKEKKKDEKAVDQKKRFSIDLIPDEIIDDIKKTFNSIIDIADDFFPVVSEVRNIFGRLAGVFNETIKGILKFPFKLFKSIFSLSFVPFKAIWGLLRKNKDFNRSLALITGVTSKTFGFLRDTISSGIEGLTSFISSKFKKRIAGSKVGKAVTSTFIKLSGIITAGLSLMGTVVTAMFSLIMAALPFLLIAAAIGAIYLIYKNWDKVRAKFKEWVVDPFINLIDSVWQSFKGFFSNIVASVRSFVKGTLGETVANKVFGKEDSAEESSDEKEAKKETVKDRTSIISENIRLDKASIESAGNNTELKGITKKLGELNKIMGSKGLEKTIINQAPSSNIEDLSTYMVTQ